MLNNTKLKTTTMNDQQHKSKNHNKAYSKFQKWKRQQYIFKIQKKKKTPQQWTLTNTTLNNTTVDVQQYKSKTQYTECWTIQKEKPQQWIFNNTKVKKNTNEAWIIQT